MYRNLKLVYTSNATSQNSSKLFYTGVKILCKKTILSQLLINVVVMYLSTGARFRPYFDSGNVYARGSGIRSVYGDDSLLELLETRLDLLHHFSSKFPPRKVISYSTFLSGGCRGC